MHNDPGRFTLLGDTEVERYIQTLVADVASVIEDRVSAAQYEALVLLGGYGRGEGGVEIREGRQRPHNNLDFLLVTRNLGTTKQAQLKHRIDNALVPLRRHHGIGIDLGIISAFKLRTAPSLVMWYDMRFGHKTVLGCQSFVQSLSHFCLENIPAWNIRDLLVNRGTLLIINDLLAQGCTREVETTRTLIKHAMKAIIGYGDAWLFFMGRYHWSYVQKRENMRYSTEVDPHFQQLYEAAIEFRFHPCYDRYLDGPRRGWIEKMRPSLAAVHLHCEAKRLRRPELNWSDYLEAALRDSFVQGLKSPRAVTRKILNLRQTASTSLGESWSAKFGSRLAGMNGLLCVLFPAIAYPGVDPRLVQAAAHGLGVSDGGSDGLRRCYLQLWGRHMDVNFQSLLDSAGLSLGAHGRWAKTGKAA